MCINDREVKEEEKNDDNYDDSDVLILPPKSVCKWPYLQYSSLAFELTP